MGGFLLSSLFSRVYGLDGAAVELFYSPLQRAVSCGEDGWMGMLVSWELCFLVSLIDG